MSEKANGSEMYREAFEGVLRLVQNPQYDAVREKYDPIFDEEAPDGEETIDN